MSETASVPVNTFDDKVLRIGPMPVGSLYRGATGWWGMGALIATEAFLFVYLFFTYAYFAIEDGRSWLPAELPTFKLAGPNTLILIASSGVVWWAEHQMRVRGNKRRTAIGLGVALVLAILFISIQLAEWKSKPFQLASTSYASVYFTLTGFHLAHVVAGVFMLALLLIWTALGLFDRQRMAPLSIGIAYWHFVDAVWLAVFFMIYVTPRFG